MASINGDWFHSRSSSRISELMAVRALVHASKGLRFVGMNWSAGRSHNQRLYDFANVAGVEPSTMQTKIRAMIRYGFVKDDTTCPISWTRMGKLWDDLYTVGNYTAAQKVYELTLSISLAIFAFNNSSVGYSINPANGDMPLQFLLNNLDTDQSILMTTFDAIVDGHTRRVGKNAPYWKTDLENSGLFRKTRSRLIYTDKYRSFVDEVKAFIPNRRLTDNDWKAIRDNPLIDISPFKGSIKGIFETISLEQNVDDQIVDEINTEPIIDIISEQEEAEIPEIDILSEDTRYSTSSRRVRNATWSIRIKKKYNYLCAVPNCDVNGQIFVEAAHIKPDNVANDRSTPHRAHILNGLCLCRHCHIAFDRGYFTLSDNHRIIASPKLDEFVNQNIKTVINSSNNLPLKNREDGRMPLVEFIKYHRKYKFKV